MLYIACPVQGYLGLICQMLVQIGFLYLRYAADPKTLWNWFEPYVKDEEVLKGVQLLLSNGIWYFIFHYNLKKYRNS